MTLLAIHHFTYYSGDIHDYPSISFSVLISQQNTRATLNMFQCGKLLWRMPISLLPRNPESGALAKEYYDRKLPSSVLQPNDHVLVRNLSERRGPGKLRAHWADQIHRIVRQRGPDSPVYEVKPETGTGLTCVLHRNLFLPCDSLPLDSDLPKKVPVPKQESKQVPSRRQRQFKHQLLHV